LKGTVIKNTGSWYTVRLWDGEIYECRIKGNFRIKGIKTTNPVAVGDRVELDSVENDKIGLITRIEERENCIIRRSTNLSKITHILAANIDQAILVVTLAFPRTSSGFIDRFLLAAESYFIPSILIFNKIDLYEDELIELHQEFISVYQKAGYTCLETSALRGDGLNELIHLMKDKTSMLSGHSGVGKSALINAIAPEIHLKTGDVSSFSNKGKHTTTFAEMYALPFGGDIIDTPGIKEFGMYDFKKEEISLFFPEMKPLIHNCQFTNCTHEHEPRCAIKQAVKEGTISEMRYKNYLNIINGREVDTPDWELK